MLLQDMLLRPASKAFYQASLNHALIHRHFAQCRRAFYISDDESQLLVLWRRRSSNSTPH